MRRLAILGTLVLFAPAVASAQATRDAPWRLTGISKDQRTLKLVYEGSGCFPADGRPVVDTSVTGRVSIHVLQSDLSGPYRPCEQFLAFYKLSVPLGESLDGRRITGGPDFRGLFPVLKVPRLVGLRKSDARRAARRQSVKTRVRGDRTGVGIVVGQSPRPGTKVTDATRVTLRVVVPD